MKIGTNFDYENSKRKKKLKGKCIENIKKFRYKTFRLYVIIIKILKIIFK